MKIRIHRIGTVSLIASLLLSACYYPGARQAPSTSRTVAVLHLPYDLALDAVMNVIKAHDYRIHANDPTHGVIEAQTPRFTIADADCGIVGTAFGKQLVTPTQDSSAVFTFHIKPKGPEESVVLIQAVFSTPIRVPFHPPSNAECVSRGVQEAQLLNEIEQQAALTHRPKYKTPPPAGSAPSP
ncbi:MAG: hypothetical protein ABSD31_09050 [Candidatus Binataceae bacterium]|jgi:hypothetical protein